MNGMMWWDNSKKSHKDKIQEAIVYFENKYGKNLLGRVFVNSSVVVDENECVSGLTIRPHQSILKDHYWLVLKDEFDNLVLNSVGLDK